MLQDFHWRVSNSGPRGSLLLNNKAELTQRVWTERKGQNFLNVKQACAIESNQMNLKQEYLFRDLRKTTHIFSESTRALVHGDSKIFGTSMTGISRKSKKIKQYSRERNFGLDKKKQKPFHPYKIYQAIKKEIGYDFAPNVLNINLFHQRDLADSLRHTPQTLPPQNITPLHLRSHILPPWPRANYLLPFNPTLIFEPHPFTPLPPPSAPTPKFTIKVKFL
jgi:hypothetical protein